MKISGALVAGLRGAAPADERGFLTVAKLAKYTQERVRSWVRMHRQEHLDLSRGTEKRSDEWAEQLSLAIDSQRSRTVAEYQRRRVLALVRLKENIGEILDGRSFEDIKAFLPSGGLPSPEAEKLLKGIEALDGGEITQRSLLHLFGELQRPQVTQKREFPKKWLVAAVLILAVGVFGWMQQPGGKDPVQIVEPAPQVPESKEEEPKPVEVKVVPADQPAPSTLIGKPPEIEKKQEPESKPVQDKKEEPARPPESTSTKPKPEVVTRAVPPPETKKDESSAVQALPTEPPVFSPAEAKKDEQAAGKGAARASARAACGHRGSSSA